jgi:uncharacterized membrane protein
MVRGINKANIFDDNEDKARFLERHLLSFIYIGIYWNNHHHMLHVTQCVGGSIL